MHIYILLTHEAHDIEDIEAIAHNQMVSEKEPGVVHSLDVEKAEH
jgi:hypothetical protein